MTGECVVGIGVGVHVCVDVQKGGGESNDGRDHL